MFLLLSNFTSSVFRRYIDVDATVSRLCICVRAYGNRRKSVLSFTTCKRFSLTAIFKDFNVAMAIVERDPSRYLPDYDIQAPKQQQFSPYADNGGSVVALAGDDFSIIAADTRLSTGYSIYTRTQEKVFKLSDSTVLGCSGCWCDTLTLTRVMAARMQMYEHEHNKTMSTPAAAQMLSTMLYYKRFFPYYVSNILAGLDEDGKGVIYRYDPVGHCEKNTYVAGGSAGAFLQPLLDNQIGYLNQENVEKIPLTKEKALAVMKDVFISAAERDIYTGDGITIKIITKDGIVDETFKLRAD